jgi:geranylgeranyl reductase family protein
LTYDVIVVGAGPAGSIAAFECANRGFTTLLLEKSQLPREKACGGAVMYRGIRILEGHIPRTIVEQKIYGLRFALPNGKKTEFISDKMIGITVFRDRFDEYLARRAVNAGSELLEDAQVLRASTSDDCALVRLKDGREFKSKFLIGADGVNSVVSRSLGLRPQRKDLTKVGLGMESDFYIGADGVKQATNGNPSVLEIIPAENRISYGWVFPKREHLAIGVAGAGVHMRALRPTFDLFYKNIERKIGIPLTLEKRRTSFLGGDGLGSVNVVDRAILVGDAAGFVDPMMGEGIAYAMQSSIFAADVISNAIEEEKHDSVQLSEYHTLCKKEFSANFQMAAWAGSKGASFAEKILPSVNGYKLASDVMAMVARGEIGYADIPYVILKNLPRQLPHILYQVVQSRISHHTENLLR